MSAAELFPDVVRRKIVRWVCVQTICQRACQCASGIAVAPANLPMWQQDFVVACSAVCSCWLWHSAVPGLSEWNAVIVPLRIGVVPLG